MAAAPTGVPTDARLQNVQAAHDIIANARERIAAARGAIAARETSRTSAAAPATAPEEAVSPTPTLSMPVTEHNAPSEVRAPTLHVAPPAAPQVEPPRQPAERVNEGADAIEPPKSERSERAEPRPSQQMAQPYPSEPPAPPRPSPPPSAMLRDIPTNNPPAMPPPVSQATQPMPQQRQQPPLVRPMGPVGPAPAPPAAPHPNARAPSRAAPPGPT